MEVSSHTKQDRRAVVLQAIKTLKEAFPIQRNIENADTLLQQAYREVLSYWIRLACRRPKIGWLNHH
jgi:hypothetical protein